MKTLLLLLTVSIFSGDLLAQTTGLDQQLSVTKDAIARLTRDLQVRDSAGGLRLTDYRIWEADFKREMEKNFIQYEKDISQRVFGPLKAVLAKMNAVAEDKSLEDHQKQSLLNSYKTQLESMTPSIQAEYHRLLSNLYNSNNILPVGLTVIETEYTNSKGKPTKKEVQEGYTIKSLSPLFFDNKTSSSVYKIKEKALRNYFFYGNDIKINTDATNPNRWTVRDTNCNYNQECRDLVSLSAEFLIMKMAPYHFSMGRITEGCQSKSCLIIKASDLTFWFHSVKSLLDKEISIVLPIEYIEESKHYPYAKNKKPATLRIPALNLNIQNQINVLNKNDFPAELENLPFDI